MINHNEKLPYFWFKKYSSKWKWYFKCCFSFDSHIWQIDFARLVWRSFCINPTLNREKPWGYIFLNLSFREFWHYNSLLARLSFSYWTNLPWESIQDWVTSPLGTGRGRLLVCLRTTANGRNPTPSRGALKPAKIKMSLSQNWGKKWG